MGPQPCLGGKRCGSGCRADKTIAHRYLQRKVETMMLEMEHIAFEFLRKQYPAD